MTNEWKPITLVSNISETNTTLQAEFGGKPICIYNIDGDIYATQDICPHGNARLSEGYVEDGTIECPLHQGVFNVRTGAPLCPPVTTNLECYDIKVEEGQVFIKERE